MATLFYYKYSASMFLDRSGFKVPSQVLTKIAERKYFDENQQTWVLTFFYGKAFYSLLCQRFFQNVPDSAFFEFVRSIIGFNF